MPEILVTSLLLASIITAVLTAPLVWRSSRAPFVTSLWVFALPGLLSVASLWSLMANPWSWGGASFLVVLGLGGLGALVVVLIATLLDARDLRDVSLIVGVHALVLAAGTLFVLRQGPIGMG
ncbi:hypothetical protein [Deinococcus pimensis]|uniref:hypothetical protein n=1 Tax=Deinococcus pimensis TaxID=309888 RepID=UPI0004809B2F|nr:hypothetical protein [Deinococcus pimensis]